MNSNPALEIIPTPVNRAVTATARVALVVVTIAGLMFPAEPAAGADCVLAPPGLVAWWPGQGDANDQIGTNHGTIFGATFAAGQVGQAFSFNGSASIQIADAPELRPTTNLTIEGWIKTPGVLDSAQVGFIAARSGNGFTGYESGIATPSQGGQVRILLNGATGLFSTNSVSDNLFHHVATTYDGAMLRIYRDGVCEGELAMTQPINYTAGDVLLLGRREYAPVPGNFPGLIDELSIYNRALTASEIAAIHAAGSAGKCLRRVEWFKIAGGGGESTNATHRLRGTIGQQDAGGPWTNTMYSLVGGFWPPANNHETPAACAPIAPGMIGWWRADGDALDSASTNHGTISGATFTDGKVGSAFHLDGTDQISFGTQIGNFGSADFTIEFWIATTNTTRLDVILSKRPACELVNFWNFYLRPDGRVNLEWCGGTPVNFGMDSTTFINHGLYHHVAWRREGTNYSLVIDGVVEAAAGLPLVNFNNAAPLLVGNSPCVGFGATRLLGQLDELAIHNRALSLAELQAIHRAGSLGRCDTRPTLNIAALPGAVRLTWTTNATGYLLETNRALNFPAGWGVLTSNYSVLNTNYAVTNAIGGATRFYRLSKP